MRGILLLPFHCSVPMADICFYVFHFFRFHIEGRSRSVGLGLFHSAARPPGSSMASHVTWFPSFFKAE